MSWDAFCQKLALFCWFPSAWEMQPMLLGLENEGRRVEMVRCGCAKCPVGPCRSLRSPLHSLAEAPRAQTDVAGIARCLSLTPALTGLQIFGSWCCLYLCNSYRVSWIRVLPEERTLGSVSICPARKCCCCFWACSGDGTGTGAALPLLALCLPHSRGSSAVLLRTEIVVLEMLLKYEAITAYFCSRSKFFLE